MTHKSDNEVMVDVQAQVQDGKWMPVSNVTCKKSWTRLLADARRAATQNTSVDCSCVRPRRRLRSPCPRDRRTEP